MMRSADTELSGSAADLLLTVWHRPSAKPAVAPDPERCGRILDPIHV